MENKLLFVNSLFDLESCVVRGKLLLRFLREGSFQLRLICANLVIYGAE